MKLLLFEEFFWSQMRIWQHLCQKRLLLTALPFQLRKGDGLPTLFAAQFVETAVIGHAKEPGFERCIGSQFGQRRVALEKDILQDIRHQVMIFEDSPDIATQ